MGKRNRIAEGAWAFARAPNSMDIENSRGSVQEKWIRCGNAGCHCNQGGKHRHGPYYYRQYWEHGTTRTVYLGKKRPKGPVSLS